MDDASIAKIDRQTKPLAYRYYTTRGFIGQAAKLK